MVSPVLRSTMLTLAMKPFTLLFLLMPYYTTQPPELQSTIQLLFVHYSLGFGCEKHKRFSVFGRWVYVDCLPKSLAVNELRRRRGPRPASPWHSTTYARALRLRFFRDKYPIAQRELPTECPSQLFPRYENGQRKFFPKLFAIAMQSGRFPAKDA
jgi:hypothetical protein